MSRIGHGGAAYRKPTGVSRSTIAHLLVHFTVSVNQSRCLSRETIMIEDKCKCKRFFVLGRTLGEMNAILTSMSSSLSQFLSHAREVQSRTLL